MNLTTDKLKTFITEIIATNDVVRGELDAHELDGSKPSQWSRMRKRKLKENNVEEVDFLFEDTRTEIGTSWIDIKEDELVGCVERLFVYRDPEGEGDACFGIISDPKDERVVGWAFNVD